MRTERVFLMELFLDDELPKKIKLMIKERFQELEERREMVETIRPSNVAQYMPEVAQQSPSMQRIMVHNPDLIPKPPIPVTPQAAQALAARQALINGAGKEKPDEGRRSPRKL